MTIMSITAAIRNHRKKFANQYFKLRHLLFFSWMIPFISKIFSIHYSKLFLLNAISGIFSLNWSQNHILVSDTVLKNDGSWSLTLLWNRFTVSKVLKVWKFFKLSKNRKVHKDLIAYHSSTRLCKSVPKRQNCRMPVLFICWIILGHFIFAVFCAFLLQSHFLFSFFREHIFSAV